MLLVEYTKVKAPTPFAVTKLLTHPLVGADPSLLYGVELEIEGLRWDNGPEDLCVPGVTSHEDGSLRNNGYEFVTQPMRMRELEYVLNQFFHKNKFTDTNYSERCSTHVHINTTDLTMDQIKTILTLYLVFEGLLFNWVGHDRHEKVFCVPLSATRMSHAMIHNASINHWITQTKRWEKYTALNLAPLWVLGTIEFRHLYGTSDLPTILTWCNLIGSLVAWARTHTLDETVSRLKSLNNNSRYQEITNAVFGQWAAALLVNPNLNNILEEGVLSLKYGLANITKTSPTKKEATPFGFFADAGAARGAQQVTAEMRELIRQNRVAVEAVQRAGIQPAPRPGDWVVLDDIVDPDFAAAPPVARVAPDPDARIRGGNPFAAPARPRPRNP